MMLLRNRKTVLYESDFDSNSVSDSDSSSETSSTTYCVKKKKKMGDKLKNRKVGGKLEKNSNQIPIHNSEDEADNPYLLKRRKNIEEKMQILRMLNVGKDVEELKALNPPKPRVLKEKLPKLERIRFSARLAKQPPVLLNNMPVTEDEAQLPAKPRSQGCELMKPVIINEDEDIKTSLGDLLPYLKDIGNKGSKRESLDSFKASVMQLELHPDLVRKVVFKRPMSLAVHPSESVVLVIASDEVGNVGFWRVEDKGESAVEVFRPHRNAVHHICVSNYNPSVLFSTSIDGVVRRCDIENLTFSDVYVSDENMKLNHTPFHSEFSREVLMVAHGNGSIGFVDLRAEKKVVRFHQCHEQSVRSVQRHPLQDNIFVTASRLREVCIWDARKHKAQEPLFHLPHPKSVRSAFFSPQGAFLLTTCMDNRLRVYRCGNLDTSKLQVVMNAQHNNQTGPWLTPFRAVWHPQRQDIFIIGSMEQPRKVDVFGIHGLVIHEMRSEFMKTIMSCCHFHPSRLLVAGANSSGRVHVFMPPQ